MTQEQRVNYMRTALAITGICVENYHAELLIAVNDLVIEKQGETDLQSLTKLKCEIDNKYKAMETDKK